VGGLGERRDVSAWGFFSTPVEVAERIARDALLLLPYLGLEVGFSVVASGICGCALFTHASKNRMENKKKAFICRVLGLAGLGLSAFLSP